MPDDTQVCPGHDYFENNLRFAPAREPDDALARTLLSSVAGQDPATLHVSTLGEEKLVNSFLRLTSASVIEALRLAFPDLPKQPDPKTVFVKLRDSRNRW